MSKVLKEDLTQGKGDGLLLTDDRELWDEHFEQIDRDEWEQKGKLLRQKSNKKTFVYGGK